MGYEYPSRGSQHHQAALEEESQDGIGLDSIKEEEVMGYCWEYVDNGKFPKCDGRLIVDHVDTSKLNKELIEQLPCRGWGGGHDGKTKTCTGYCNTSKEAKETLADWKKAMGVE